MYKYVFTGVAVKQLKKLSGVTQRRLLKKLDYFCGSDPFVFAEKLIDSRLGSYRFRVGDLRIVFDREDEDTIVVLAVGNRKEIYRF